MNGTPQISRQAIMERIRQWLTRNSIFMDLIQKVIVAIASVVVAIFAVRIAGVYYQQQLNLVGVSIEPDLFVETQMRNRPIQKENEPIKVVRDRWLEIQNVGGPAHKLSVDIETFIAVKRTLDLPGFAPEVVNTPVYFTGFYS
jgi:hypothetical protein